MKFKKIRRNKHWIPILVAGVLGILPHAALAQENGLTKSHSYFGGGIARMEYDERLDMADGFFNAKVGAAYLRLGRQFNDHISLEARAGLGGDATGDITVGNNTVEIDYELEHFLGAYARVGLWAGDSFYPYLIGGFTRFKHTVAASSAGIEVSGGGDFSWGLGADIATSEKWRINLEYMRLYDDRDTDDIADFEYSALAIGLVRIF